MAPAADVPAYFFVDGESLEKWKFLKGAKSLTRISRSTGMEYTYDEGPIPFPDRTDGPSRTILTGEGGATPSRFKHLIQTEDGLDEIDCDKFPLAATYDEVVSALGELRRTGLVRLARRRLMVPDPDALARYADWTDGYLRPRPLF